MQIYLLRHGVAEDAVPEMRDQDRALTKEGRDKLSRVLERAAKAGVNPSIILSSPYLRAMQTAEVAAKALRHNGKIIEMPALVPHSTPYAVWRELRERRDETQCLLAGHEPLMSSLVAYLLAADNLQVDFKKAALVRIDMDSFRGEPRGLLKWMITPATSE